MHALSRVARESAGRIAALTVSTGAVSASRGPAHARVPVQRSEVAHPLSACQDEWLITQVDAGNVLFHAEDIDDVANSVLQLVPRQPIQSGNRSECTDSDGQEASNIIEANDIGAPSVSRGAPVGGYDVLLRVASELMKKPGVQKQVLDVIMEDPELLSMLSEKSNMDNYLTLWGVSSSGLLPPATVIEEAEEEDPESSPVDQLMSQLMTAFGKMGEAMQHVGDWLRGIFQGHRHSKDDHTAGAADKQAGGRRGFLNAFMDNPILKAAVMVGVMLACALLLRKPQLLAALVRRRAAAAAATAAVGVAGAAAAAK